MIYSTRTPRYLSVQEVALANLMDDVCGLFPLPRAKFPIGPETYVNVSQQHQHSNKEN
jgi:hypothetical protein